MQIQKLIYMFHMPLFFVLSGYLFDSNKYGYSDLIKNKVRRLLYPFATIAGVFLAIKYLASLIVPLDCPVNLSSIYALLLDPIHSYMPLLWFIHALFLIFAVYPILRLFISDIAVLIIVLSLNTIFGSNFPLFGNALGYMPFFLVGVILKTNKKIMSTTIGNNQSQIFVPIVLFIVAYTLKTSLYSSLNSVYLYRFFLGVIGSIAVMNIGSFISTYSNNRISEILQRIGYFSMGIYLFHTLFESTVRVALLNVSRYAFLPFELVAVVSILSGLVFPLILEDKLLRRFKLTRKTVLGLT
jgi:fucose 4-O-acetylase-like acetyltransferase